MTHTFLLEIGLEDMPAKVIKPAVAHLKEHVALFFKENSLSFSSIDTYSTPRRLAIVVSELEERQADQTETVRGPAKRIALDEDGNWTKAAIGFTRGQGASTDDIVFQEVKGEEYVFVKKFIKGQTASELVGQLTPVLASIPFPVTMKWGQTTHRYIRPVHWLVAMLDSTPVNLSLFGIEAGQVSKGHRFLGQDTRLSHAQDYVDALKEQKVIVNREERKGMIEEQISSLCKDKGWLSPLDNTSLLEEVTDLVEFPTAFYGSFNDEFLTVPEIVLETAMADHQRYFPVRQDNAEKTFLPHFIAVRNGNSQDIDHVRKGNEKVLSARLADAAFFYNEDKKLSIDDFVSKLSSVSFHEKLGSLYDKQVRVKSLVHQLAPYFHVAEEHVAELERAAMISKFDLVTQTVNEFTSLQGKIGGIFADEREESESVSLAISEQYLPVSMDGELPSTILGAVLSVADKLDSLLSFFSVGLIPTGSNDPFALRRQAMGIVRILASYTVSLPLDDIFDNMNLDAKSMEQKNSLIRFIKDRVDQWLAKEAGLSNDHDIRAAVLGSSQTDVVQLIDSALVLKEKKANPAFKAIVESLTRTANLAEKADETIRVDEALLESASEKSLYQATVESETVVSNSLSASVRFDQLAGLHDKIDTFFDENMVMADDPSVRANRLALLYRVNNLAKPFADFNALVIK